MIVAAIGLSKSYSARIWKHLKEKLIPFIKSEVWNDNSESQYVDAELSVMFLEDNWKRMMEESAKNVIKAFKNEANVDVSAWYSPLAALESTISSMWGIQYEEHEAYQLLERLRG